jgi:hypothetical protein
MLNRMIVEERNQFINDIDSHLATTDFATKKCLSDKDNFDKDSSIKHIVILNRLLKGDMVSHDDINFCIGNMFSALNKFEHAGLK